MNADFTKWSAELAEGTEVVEHLCVCGHDQERHDHIRAGDDCGTCGRHVCPTYRNPNTISVSLTVGWVLILAGAALVWFGAAWVASNIIQWVGAL